MLQTLARGAENFNTYYEEGICDENIRLGDFAARDLRRGAFVSRELWLSIAKNYGVTYS